MVANIKAMVSVSKEKSWSVVIKMPDCYSGGCGLKSLFGQLFSDHRKLLSCSHVHLSRAILLRLVCLLVVFKILCLGKTK